MEAFDATMQGGDMVGLYAFMPPGVKAALVEMSGLTEDEIKAQMAEQIEAAMAGATIDDFAMDAAAATYLETPEGGRSYALIPTTTDVTIEGQGRFRATSQTVGIEDGGAWWLVRVEDPQQVMILQQAYPEFAGVTFPAGATEPLE